MCCPLILATSLALFGFVASFVSLAAMVSQNGGQFGPDTRVGWPNRVESLPLLRLADDRDERGCLRRATFHANEARERTNASATAGYRAAAETP
jgi:hypothetical protein